MTTGISTTQLKDACEQGLAYLRQQQKANGAITAANYGTFDVWETIEAAMAITLWAEQESLQNDAVLSAAMAFLASSETDDGMVPDSAKRTDLYCIETSSEYLQLLKTLLERQFPQRTDVINQAQYICEKQLNDGRWRIENPAVSEDVQHLPSVTAFAMLALLRVDTEPKYFLQALTFLTEGQLANGTWGQHWQYYETPFYLMAPICELLQRLNDNGRFDSYLAKAQRFVLSEQQSDGRLVSGQTDGENQISESLHTVLGLKTLLATGIQLDDPNVQKALKWLLSQQSENGCWHGGVFPHPNVKIKKNEDVFCSAQVLTMLNRYWQLSQGYKV
ncbi:prenyltransferase/squalene oxidase repeat-containing protein [Pseudoalteromonas maricaloris]|uniref:prenyltransferase/squalene oxidase repeat-containing protein n=1 Tax=Pseudoalteromonas maricaloris TaxID=184924 RepID=UPI00029A6F81|nr:A-macroglobulin complement component [Pseudoalteromonas flavipulchra]